MHIAATTFSQHAAVLGEESPSALVLDSWRRLDAALLDYANAFHLLQPDADRGNFERLLDRDPFLGWQVGGRVRQLRVFRNAVAHHEQLPLSSDRAQVFAHHCFELIGVVGYRLPRVRFGAD